MHHFGVDKMMHRINLLLFYIFINGFFRCGHNIVQHRNKKV